MTNAEKIGKIIDEIYTRLSDENGCAYCYDALADNFRIVLKRELPEYAMPKMDYEEAKKKIAKTLVSEFIALGIEEFPNPIAEEILKALGIEPAKPGKEKG